MSQYHKADVPLNAPNWPAPKGVRAYLTTREGGCSSAPWDGLNLASHVGDDLGAVQNNRKQVFEKLEGATQLQWLEQVHGTTVVEARYNDAVPRADATWSREPGVVCAVQTADCLPVLLCDRDATVVAAVHAGWRGLAAGVIRSTIASLSALSIKPQQLLAYLGPAICARCFEVGPEVRARFLEGAGDAQQRESIATCFQPAPERRDHYLADLSGLARGQLFALGVQDVYGGELCTMEMPDTYYSYRRDGCTGRQAALIYLAK